MTINEKFIINLQGSSYVTYEGLLDIAHKKSLKSIVVDLIQNPTAENNMTAIEELSVDENVSGNEEIYSGTTEEPPTKRQIETIKKLSGELNININYDELTKKSAGSLISRMLEEVKKT